VKCLLQYFIGFFKAFVIKYIWAINKSIGKKAFKSPSVVIKNNVFFNIESERESGYGRVDILMTPKDKNKPGIIIEMKKIRPRETTETAIEAALQQIEDRQYEASLRQQGCTHIMKIAVTFDGKRVWAKTK